MRPVLPKLTAALAAVLVLTACPSEPDGPCAGGGTLDVSAQPNRLDTAPIDDGSQLPVFPPPQGGVFTELDVAVSGVASEQIERVAVRVDDESGAALALQEYNGAGLPWMCQPDDTAVVFGLPVGFDLSVQLAALDGVDAELTLTVDGAGQSLEQRWSVVLRQTE